MVRRHERSHALPNAYVFPGGTLRPDDAEIPPSVAFTPQTLHDALCERSDDDLPKRVAAGLFVCAARELLEETGVLLAQPTSERAAVRADAPALQVRLNAERVSLQRGDRSMADLLRDLDMAPNFSALVPYSHWITPDISPIRWDTWFFVARMPDKQEALHCQIETSDGVWVRPSDVIRGASTGEYEVVYPTLRHLERAAESESVDDLLHRASTKVIRRVQPFAKREAGIFHAWLPEALEAAW